MIRVPADSDAHAYAKTTYYSPHEILWVVSFYLSRGISPSMAYTFQYPVQLHEDDE